MVTLLVPFLSGVTILPFLNPSTKDSLGLYLLSGFLVIYNRRAICAAIISSWAKWKSPVVFNDSIEQDFSHRSLSRISHGCSVSGSCQGGSRDDSGHFYWTTLGKHQGFFFFFAFNPKPVLLDNFNPVFAIKFPFIFPEYWHLHKHYL